MVDNIPDFTNIDTLAWRDSDILFIVLIWHVVSLPLTFKK